MCFSSWLSWRAALRMASGLTYLTLISIVYFRSSPSHRSTCRTAPIRSKKLEKKSEKQLKLLKPSKKSEQFQKFGKSSGQPEQRQFAPDDRKTTSTRPADRDGSVSSAISGLNSSDLNNSLNGGPAAVNSGNSSDTKANTESNRSSETRTLSTTASATVSTTNNTANSCLTSSSLANTETVCIDMDEDSSGQCKASRSFASFLFRRQSSEQSDRKLEERLERALSNKAIPKRALPIRALSPRRTVLARRTPATRRALPARRLVRPERWSLKRLFDLLKQCRLNNLLRKIIRSANLAEYLSLLKSRDLRLIIIFYFLGSLGQIYLAIVVSCIL